jgi:hypothetical protein
MRLVFARAVGEAAVLRRLRDLGNEHVLKPFDLKIVRRSRAFSPSEDADEFEGRYIVFFHAPKCGGTSVNRWLATAFGAPAGLDPIAAEAAARNLDIPGPKLREAVLSYVVQRKNARLLSGHYYYSRRAFLGHENEFDLLTILRNPLERLLSNYYFNRFREGQPHFPIESELLEWLSTDHARATATVFTRMFVGDSDAVVAMDERDHDMRPDVASAIRNLETFTIVGTLERLAEFEAAVRQRYGIKSSIGHFRKSPRPDYPRFAEQPAEVQERLRELCEPDMAIYQRFA